MNYIGVIIEESLANKDILKEIKLLSTKIEKVTGKHKTPWLKHWTIHEVEISAEKAAKIAEKISKSLDLEHHWYADYKNENFHFIVFRNKVFRIDKMKSKQYEEAKAYGISIGIPEHQVDFHPDKKEWKR